MNENWKILVVVEWIDTGTIYKRRQLEKLVYITCMETEFQIT
jgi:hypothetical protein